MQSIGVKLHKQLLTFAFHVMYPVCAREPETAKFL